MSLRVKNKPLYDSRLVKVALAEKELDHQAWVKKTRLNKNTLTSVRRARDTKVSNLVAALKPLGLAIQIVRVDAPQAREGVGLAIVGKAKASK